MIWFLYCTITIFLLSKKEKRRRKFVLKTFERNEQQQTVDVKTCRGAGKNQRGSDPITELQPYNWFWKALKLLDSDLDLHQCGVVTDYLLQFYIDMESKLKIIKLRVNHYARITIDIAFFFNFKFFFQFQICLKGIVYHYLILYLNTSLLSLHSLIEPHSTCCLAVKQISE